jgi:taurine dioxygenase
MEDAPDGLVSEPLLEIEPIGGYLGATVRGLDASAMDEATALALKAALAEHLVVFLPGLAPTVSGLREIGALFGPLETHPYLPKADEAVPEVCELDSDTPAGVRADLWHTDVTFSESPPVAALLHMVGGPESGGDTMWINCHEVFDSLSLPMQDFLTGLTCIHDDAGQGGMKAEHPVVRVHPDTGRRSLYVNKQFSRRIPQLSRPESQAMLGYLFRWQEQVKFSCRWRWSVGDVALWDERATLHAVVDDTEARRLLRRVTVLGDYPEAPEGAREWPRHKNAVAASSDFYGIGGYEF